MTRSIYDDPTPATPTANPAATTTDDFDYDNIGNRETAYLKSANATTYLANVVNEYTKSTLSGTDNDLTNDLGTPITVGKSRAIQCRDPFFLFSKATRWTRALQTPIRTVSLNPRDRA